MVNVTQTLEDSMILVFAEKIGISKESALGYLRNFILNSITFENFKKELMSCQNLKPQL